MKVELHVSEGRREKQKTHLAIGGWVKRETGFGGSNYPNRHARVALL
jgi:hypothetical protein